MGDLELQSRREEQHQQLVDLHQELVGVLAARQARHPLEDQADNLIEY